MSRRLDKTCDRPNRKLTLKDIGNKSKWYNATWGIRSITVEVYKYKTRLPEPPPRSEFINYGLKVDDQKFRRTTIPRQLNFWDKRRKEAYIEREWHRRYNGVWILIKGNPIYIPGTYYTYLNYWHVAKGGLPQFRMGDLEFFWAWMDAIRDPGCLGVVDYKARRLGDTEKALFLGWETVTRQRNSRTGMQNKTETEAKDNFGRLVNAASKMPDFFKPKYDGPARPKKKMSFRYPMKSSTHKSMMETSDDKEVITYYDDGLKAELNAEIDYRASNEAAYDGYAMAFYHADEPGKWERMDPNSVHDITKYCLLEKGTRKVGMSLWTTTIEDFESSETMENAMKLWEDSDPDKPVDVAITDLKGVVHVYLASKTRLRRWFRSAHNDAPVDQWGFHQHKPYIAALMAHRTRLEQDGDMRGLTNLRRKKPIEEDDMFVLNPDQCILQPAILDARKMQIKKGRHSNGEPIGTFTAKYKLIWVNGVFGGEVERVIDPDGPWSMSQAPVSPNARDFRNNRYYPRAGDSYAIGCDPIDHEAPAGGGSDFGIAVFRRRNDKAETAGGVRDLEFDDKNRVAKDHVYKTVTNQFVAIYQHRAQDPLECYEDALMAGIYFGAPILFENNKPGAGLWIKNLPDGKYAEYASGKTYRARQVGRSGSSTSPGQAATKFVIQDYTSLLLHYITHYHQAIYHVGLLDDFRKFNKKTRTLCDITVAAGYALLDAMDNVQDIIREQQNRWTDVEQIFPTYGNRTE